MVEVDIKDKGGVNLSVSENKGTCINIVGKYISKSYIVAPEGGGGTSGEGGEGIDVDIITTGDKTTPSDSNVYSALRSREEFVSAKYDDSVEGNIAFKKNVSVGGEQDVKGKQTIHEGFVTPNFNESGAQITGAQLTKEGLLTVAGLRAMSFEVYELIYNIVKAQGGRFVYSECANIDSCVYVMENGERLTPDEYYSRYRAVDFEAIQYVELTLRKDEANKGLVPFRNSDILYGYVNKIGESGQYAVGGECVMHVISPNDEIGVGGNMTIKASLFPLSSGIVSNMPPTAGMTIAQRGNIDPENNKSRLTSFFIDTTTSNIYMLENVYTPTINAGYYGVVIGKLPYDIYSKIPKSLPIKESDPVVYARYGIFENVIEFDHLGVPIPKQRDRGEWSQYIASDDTKDENGEYLNRYKNTELYYDTVTHEGEYWKCLVSDTEDEPSSTSEGWLLLVAKGAKGEDGAAGAFKSTAFKRSATKLTEAPQGGSYEDPHPYTEGWFDGVPEGDLPLYSSVRTFYSDDRDTEWSIPQLMADTRDMEFMYTPYAVYQPLDTLIKEGVELNEEWKEEAISRGWYDDTIDVNGNHFDAIWMAVANRVNGQWGEWTYTQIKGEKGDKGSDGAAGAFKSIAFKRSSTPITEAPQGGSYDDPHPNTEGWYDSVPKGRQPLYSSVCTFYSDNTNSGWSIPQLMSDTPDIEFMYTPYEIYQKLDTLIKDDVELDEAWEATANSRGWFDDTIDEQGDHFDAVWMAVASRVDGVWGEWTYTKVKGEKGDRGDDGAAGAAGAFKSTAFKRSATPLTEAPEGGSYTKPLPDTYGWSDGIPEGIYPIYASVCTFYADGSSSGWSIPQLMSDTPDIEFMYTPNENYNELDTLVKEGVDIDTRWEATANSKGWYDDTVDIYGNHFDAVWMAVANRVNGQWEKWTYTKIKGEKGDGGAFKSIAFKRSSTPITEVPQGGSYDRPFPDTDGWSDGIPKGTAQVYSSYCIFYVDGGSSGWSAPLMMLDNDEFDVEYSTEVRPSAPVGHPNTNPEWTNNPSEDVIWMATSNRHAGGEWGAWVVSKIKGEKGDSPIYADLDNEVDNVGLTYDGLADADYTLVSNVGMWLGTTSLPLSNITVTTPEGSNVAVNVIRSGGKPTGRVEFVVKYGDEIKARTAIVLTLLAEGIERDLTFTVVGVRAGAQGEAAILYDILPSANQIVRKKDGSVSPEKISASVLKTQGESTTVTNEGVLTYSIDGANYEPYTNIINTSQIAKSIQFALIVDGIEMDKETISVIADGTDGISIVEVVSNYLISDKIDGIDTNDADWSTEMKAPTKEKPYLWYYQKVIFSEGEPFLSAPTIISYRSGILNVVTQYATTRGADDKPTNWQRTPHKLDNKDNKFQWSRTTVNYTDGTSDTGEAVIIGAYGDDASPTYWLHPSVPHLHADKNGKLDVNAINVTVYKCDSKGLSELTTQEELEAEGLRVQYSIDTTAPRTEFTLVDDGFIELEDGSGSIAGESDNQDTNIYTESVAIPLDSVSYYIMLWLYDVKNEMDLDSNKIEISRDGVDGHGDMVDSVWYAISDNDNVVPSDDSWSEAKPRVPKGMYLWTKVVYQSGKIAYSTSYTGTDGNNGKPIYIAGDVSSISVNTAETIDSNGVASVRVVKSVGRYVNLDCLYDNRSVFPSEYSMTASGIARLERYSDKGVDKLRVYVGIPANTLATSLPSELVVKMTVEDGGTSVTATYAIMLVQSQRGLTGPQGEAGPIYIMNGTWNHQDAIDKKYAITDPTEALPMVYYEVTNADNTKDGAYYIHGGDNSLVNKGHTPPSENSGWKLASKRDYVVTDLLMANFAKLGSKLGAIFYGKYMFSQYGKVDGIDVSVSYSEYAEDMFDTSVKDDPVLKGIFTPNLFIDFLAGSMKANRINEPFVQMPDVQIYKIELNGGHNLSIPYHGYRLVCMPNPTDIIRDGNIEVKRTWDTDGVRSTIIVQPNYQYNWNKGNNFITWSDSDETGYCVRDWAVILCADGRVVDLRSYDSEGLYKPRGYTEIQNGATELAAPQGYFVINGQLSKFLLLEPSAIVNLRSCTTKSYNGFDVTLWFVENHNDFEQLKMEVDIVNSTNNIYAFDYQYQGLGFYGAECVYGSRYFRTLLDKEEGVKIKYVIDLEEGTVSV